MLKDLEPAVYSLVPAKIGSASGKKVMAYHTTNYGRS
jgi:hypothetical protein